MAKKTAKAVSKTKETKKASATKAEKAPKTEKMKKVEEIVVVAKAEKLEKVEKPVKAEKAPKAEKPVKVSAKEKKAAAHAAEVLSEANKKWLEYKQKHGDEKAASYSMAGIFSVNSPIQHKTFGWGYVIKSENDRLEVLFETGAKQLISNYKS